MGLFKNKGSQAEEKKKTNQEIITEICETVKGAKEQLDLIKEEYEKVNGYLQDAQLISELPTEVIEHLSEQVKKLADLKKGLDSLDGKKVDMTLFEFGLMERFDRELEKDIKIMKRDEEYKKVVEGDLRKLAGEKGVLIHEEAEEKGKRKFLLRMSLISGFLVVFLLLMYLSFYLIFETFLEIPFLATIGGAVLLIAYLLFEMDRNKKAIQLNVLKMNKLTILTNKVKIKYVNQTSALDFIHDKYAVNTALELEDRYKKYVAYKEEESKRKKVISSYDRVNEDFKNTLKEYYIKDCEIWTFHPHAVVDKKEMVEIRHKLNERRAKLREMLEFNYKIVEENANKLRNLAEKFPENRRMIYEMAESYKMEL